jgi:signal transduction histidine kinase
VTVVRPPARRWTRSSAHVAVTGGTLVAAIDDDGVGGADPYSGSGLRGLVDRIDAVGGRMELSSPPGSGTRLCARLPTTVLGALDEAPAPLAR